MRQATSADESLIAALLQKGARVYCNLDEDRLPGLLYEGLNVLAFREEQPVGLFLAGPETTTRFRVHGFAVTNRSEIDTALVTMLPLVCQLAADRKIRHIMYLDNVDWFTRALQCTAFVPRGAVIDLEKWGHRIPSSGNYRVRLRPMESTDIAALVALDEVAFVDIWRLDASAFERIRTEAPYLAVADLSGHIVGYQFNWIGASGYLARLAVHPNYWGQGIGTRMLAEAIRFFERQGVEHIILDTQADNERSQRLYRWFGFTPTGRARDVLVLEIMSARNVSVRALITDFGGVLTRTEKLRALMEHYERELGLEKGTLQTTLFAGEAWEAFSTGRISYEDYWANVCARLGWPIPPEFESLRDNPFALDDLDERMVALLRQLRSNYKIALLSNATPALEGLLERYGIANLFDVVINSSRVGLRKPDLRIYALTAERLGLRPEECLLIDDKERNTSAAREIGMHAITFTSYEDLTRHLEKMLGRSVTA